MDKIKSAGASGCACSGCNNTEQATEKSRYYTKLAVAAAGCIFVVAQLLEWLNGISPAVIILYFLAIIFGGLYTAKSAARSLRLGKMDINTLLCVAVAGAATLGQWGEGAAVVFLFALGNILQSITMDRTQRSIYNMLKLAPQEAVILENGQEIKLPIAAIKPDNIVLVKPGEQIPVDGKVKKGCSSVNQSAITGESMPVDKSPGDQVFAGTINYEGTLEIITTKLSEETTISKVMKLIEKAQNEKAPLQQFVDWFAGYYTPFVICTAIMLTIIPWAIFNQPFSIWFYKALVLLVISCPCAMVIATPVAIISAIGKASKQGILIKSAAVLENLYKTTALIFDKTGTLTAGRPEVTDILIFFAKTEENLLRIAVSLEQYSEHPVAKAIVRHAKGRISEIEAGAALISIDEFSALPGRGAKAKINGQTYYVGNKRLFSELKLSTEDYIEQIDKLEMQGKTVTLVGTESELLGLIAVRDILREVSLAAVTSLSKSRDIIMLTGDNRNSARIIAEQLGIKQYFSELLPADKVQKVKELQENKQFTTMIGDGINDAPALAVANIGIAMGAAGSDAALDTADIVLMTDDLNNLAYTIELSSKTMGIIKANIYFARLIVK